MTQPTRMPRTTLEFISGVDTPLAPGRGEHYYSTPNPMRDSSGSFQAVSAAGPPPYSQDVPLRVFILVAAGLFGVVFAVIALMMPFGSARGADSTGDSLHFMNAFFFIGGIAFVMAVGFLINSTLSRRRRIATAWKNGWNNNGWAIVGISRFPGQTHAELDPGLTHQQCEAIFNLAERNWLRTAW